MSKQLNDQLRNQYLDQIIALFNGNGEDVLRTNSNEISFPVVDANGDDQFITITVKVPTGTHDGELYDGYAIAADYAAKQAAAAEKREAAAAKKAAKIQRDAAAREARSASIKAHNA